MVEGAKLLDEARRRRRRIEAVFLDSSRPAPTDRDLAGRGAEDGIRVYEFQAGVLARAATPSPPSRWRR